MAEAWELFGRYVNPILRQAQLGRAEALANA
jgi:hypothetical protein